MSERIRLFLSAGRGPQECDWAVAELARRLEREAAAAGLATSRLDTVPGAARSTFRSVLLQVSGLGARRFAESWSGTLCWQAPSPFRRGVGRKNWYVGAELQETAPNGSSADGFSADDVDFVPVRTGGPGGQHRDKASTAVRATYRPTGAVVVADTQRRLSDNRRLALELLRQQVDRATAAAARAEGEARWRIHDGLVRGNPTRTERP